MHKLIQILALLSLCYYQSIGWAQQSPTDCTVPSEYIHQLVAEHLAVQCQGNTLTLSGQNNNVSIPIPFTLFEEKFVFFGLAQFYNGSKAVQLDPQGQVTYLEQHTIKNRLQNNEWMGWKGRFNIFMISAPNADITMTANKLQLQWPENNAVSFNIYLGPAEQQFAVLQYSYLWSWLAMICLGIEALLLILHTVLGINWALVIIFFAILLKALFLPLHLWVGKLQTRVNHYQAILDPKLKAIKLKHDGEEAHRLIMAEYKELGITPFYTLKPLIGVMIQVPILIAIFNVLGGMPEFTQASFLWIESLAYPDSVIYFTHSIPFLGNELNLLPFLMTGITILSTLLFKPSEVSPSVLKWQRYRLYAMASAFFILFYPFPAIMVLFWSMMNLLQLIQQQVVKNK
jgi:YidC/Oxa1 family membrane protein insertase